MKPKTAGGFKVYRGRECQQVDAETNFGPAQPEAWYWCPIMYHGALLFSRAYERQMDAVWDAILYMERAEQDERRQAELDLIMASSETEDMADDLPYQDRPEYVYA